MRELVESEAPAIQVVTAGLNAKQIGRLFKRADGQAIDGYMVESQGTRGRARTILHGDIRTARQTIGRSSYRATPDVSPAQ